MRRFELVEGKSSKFWQVGRDGTSLTVSFGRIGTNGQTQTKTFPTEKAAQAELDKLVREKVGKGYSEKTADKTAEKTAEEPAKETADEPVEEAAAPGTGAESPPVPEPPPAPRVAKLKPTVDHAADPGWVDAGDGYELKLVADKLVCRKGGKPLSTVPKGVKDGETAEALLTLREWLVAHRQSCIEAIESWMLRSLPVPQGVLESVWPDTAWRTALENAFVVPLDAAGAAAGAGGFLRGVSERGIGLVDPDGETTWVRAGSVVIPHPVLLDSLDDVRALASELALSQGIAQLFRETFTVRADLEAGATAVHSYADGKFLQLNHCLGQCRKLGYRVKGGSAIVRVWERGAVFEARYWIGAEDPMSESWTGDLVWIGKGDAPLAVKELPPVAYSEGVRMASSIYAARKVEEEAGNA
jgi:predicted DNA-binding WGR domain protein